VTDDKIQASARMYMRQVHGVTWYSGSRMRPGPSVCRRTCLRAWTTYELHMKPFFGFLSLSMVVTFMVRISFCIYVGMSHETIIYTILLHSYLDYKPGNCDIGVLWKWNYPHISWNWTLSLNHHHISKQKWWYGIKFKDMEIPLKLIKVTIAWCYYLLAWELPTALSMLNKTRYATRAEVRSAFSDIYRNVRRAGFGF
jgi:hypothetical protein